MKNIAIIFITLTMFLHSSAQNIVQLEYFVDADAGVGKNTLVTVTPGEDGEFPFTVNLIGVSTGYHKLYIRTKDENGKWSQTLRRNIHIIPAETNDNIIAGEYFTDADPAIGNATAFTINPQNTNVTQDFTVNTTSLNPGYHKLYARTRDTQGNWSHVARRNFEVMSPEPNSVITTEYFFDNDPGFGNGSPVTVAPQSADISEDFTSNTASLTPGFHKFYVRARDQQGKWSVTGRRHVEVITNDGPLYVTGVEYFFGDDPGVGKASFLSFSPPLQDGTFSFTIPANQLPTGADSLFLRVKDNPNNNWSLTSYKVKYYITSSCPTAIWTGLVSTDWHNAANWSCNQVPDAGTEVIIVSLTPYNCEVLAGNTASCKKITAVAGAAIKVNQNASLNVFPY